MKVSLFRNFNQVEENLEISVILEQIHSGKYKARVQALRELLRQGKSEEYDSAKRSLPAFTPSGLFDGGRKLEFLKEYSGLIILDLDDLQQEQLIVARQKIQECTYTFACFISPSGQGLKVLVKVFSRPVLHKRTFNQVKSFYEDLLKLEVDPSGKDITRLCFVSWDEVLYLNPAAACFKTYINMVEDDIDKLTATIELRHLDLTKNYEDWVRIAFALIDAIGEEGRSYFHRISQYYPAYDASQCDSQFDKCLHSGNTGVTIGTLYYLARDNGIDISKLQTAPKPSPPSPQLTLLPNDTPESPEPKKKRKKNHIDTIEKFISERYQLRFNIVTNKLELRKLDVSNPNDLTPNAQYSEPSTQYLEPRTWHPLTDYAENSLLREILKNNLKCSASLLRSILFSDYCDFFDPFRDYFTHLPSWDSETDHIRQLSETVQTTSGDLWHLCFKKWLIASVASVLDRTTVNHTAIILSGPQGVGKTTWMLNLCPPELADYLFSGTINPNNKDTLIHLAECMFINMDELENMNRTEIGTFKEIITKSAIRIRRAYGHHIEALTRRASFMGSVNSSQFLTDTTGSRRFLCFEATTINYQHNLDLKQIYSQAYELYKQGFKYYFDRDEIIAITQSNEQFQINSAEEELLLTYFQKIPLHEATRFLTAANILSRISERAKNIITINPGSIIRLGKALKKFGFEKRKSNGLCLWAVDEKSILTQN